MDSKVEADPRIEVFEKILEKDPEDEETWAYRAICLRDLENYDDSLTAIKKAIKIEPEFAPYWAFKAEILWYLNKFESSLEAVNFGLSIDQEDADCLNAKSFTLLELGKNEEALKSVNLALKNDKCSSIFWLTKAEVLAKMMKLDDALDALIVAISLLANYWSPTYLNSHAIHQPYFFLFLTVLTNPLIVFLSDLIPFLMLSPPLVFQLIAPEYIAKHRLHGRIHFHYPYFLN